MRITQAAQRLGTSPRMLRYRESLGLLPAVREAGIARRATDHPAAGTGLAASQSPRAAAAGPAGEPHRQFTDADIDAVALALDIERRYDITPAALAFALRVLTEPGPRADVAELGRRIGRVRPAAVQALDFEQERALRLLNMPRHPSSTGHSPGRAS